MKSSLLRRFARGCAIGCIALITRDAAAQMVTAHVRTKSDGAPIVGAIVSLVDSTGRVVASKLASDSGNVVFSAPFAGNYSLRVERVGLRATMTPSFLVTQKSSVDVPVLIAAESVSLQAVTVNADRRCVVRPQEGLATAQLWNEARKALNATELTQLAQATARSRNDPHRFAVRVRSFKRDLDAATLLPSHSEEVEREGETVTPFVSVDLETLARDGYMSGDLESGGTFHAPDASVLLSDRSLDTHCFRLRAPERGRRDDLIGLAFEPIDAAHGRSSQRVEVRGVLWLDRPSAELRFMEFGFVNLPFSADENQAGGRLEFRPFPDGRWIVWRWYIHAPHLVRQRLTVGGRLSDGELKVAGIQEQGAELMEVWAGGTARRRVGSVRGAVTDSLHGAPLSNTLVFLSGTSFTTRTDAAGIYRIDSLPPGIYRASIVNPGDDSLLIDPPVREFAVSAGDEKQIDIGVPSFHSLTSRLCGTPVADSTSLILGVVRREDGTQVSGSQVSVDWKDFSKPSSSQLQIAQTALETTSVAGGRYVLCGIPRDRLLTVRAKSGESRAVTSQRATHASEVRRVDLTLREP